MKNKPIFWIPVCFAASIGIVLILVALSTGLRERPGSFLREFPPHPALETAAVDLDFNSYYIAGGTPSRVYLGNYSAPLQMIEINSLTMDTTHVTIGVDGIGDEKFWSLRLKVDSPDFYLTDGVIPRIYKGNVSTWRAERYPFDSAYFLDFEPLSPTSFAIRALGKPIRENILGNLTWTEPHVRMKPGVLQKQVDGIFCTGGAMHYSPEAKLLVYSYFYRNEYIVMDSTLRVMRTGHTIDTTYHARVKVETITSTGETKFSIPQRIVNRSSFPTRRWLFVNSLLVARNENPEATEHATAVDVYQLATGEYRFSFYVFDFRGKQRMKSFQVHGDKLYALFDQHLQTWRLLPKYFGRD